MEWLTNLSTSGLLIGLTVLIAYVINQKYNSTRVTRARVKATLDDPQKAVGQEIGTDKLDFIETPDSTGWRMERVGEVIILICGILIGVLWVANTPWGEKLKFGQKDLDAKVAEAIAPKQKLLDDQDKALKAKELELEALKKGGPSDPGATATKLGGSAAGPIPDAVLTKIVYEKDQLTVRLPKLTDDKAYLCIIGTGTDPKGNVVSPLAKTAGKYEVKEVGGELVYTAKAPLGDSIQAYLLFSDGRPASFPAVIAAKK